jgi:hypothetical protein
MTHDQVCAIKAVQSAVALARKVGVADAEILKRLESARRLTKSHGKKPLHSLQPGGSWVV